MTQMYKVKVDGIGHNEFVPAGVWLTQKELDVLLERQYDDSKNDKVVCLGGRYFKPKDFKGVLEEKKLEDLAQSGSPLFDSKCIESLAKQGLLEEVYQNCIPGQKRYVEELVASGQYQLGDGKSEQKNSLVLDKIKKLRSNFSLKKGLEDES